MEDSSTHFSDDDDKKYASQAVAFVIKHSCNGFVPLCASVATLLQEQAKLKQLIESQQHLISTLKDSFSKSFKNNLTANDSNDYLIDSVNKKTSTKFSLSANKIATKIWNEQKHDKWSNREKICSTEKQNKILEGCICNKCLNFSETATVITSDLKIGEEVIVRGELIGKVLYVGHVDFDKFPAIYVGLQFDEPIGNTNGTVDQKEYFSCSTNCGLFIPLSYILCIIK